jgi:hypothetical protein
MENNDTPLHRFLTMKRKSQEASQSRFAEESRKRLDKIISTKLTTTFIGALASFEKSFGFLWGFGKKDHERTEEEKELYTIWESIRTEVLNNGNNQLRALRNELQNHNILWNRHTLVIKNNEENSDVNDA